MMDYMTSMFIDDELGIDGKIAFLEKVYGDKAYKDEAVELLYQERLIRSEVVDRVPPLAVTVRKRFLYPLIRPLALFASGVAAALIIWLAATPAPISTSQHHRFIMYQPQVTKAEITGSFTQWKRIPMKKVGSSGYWEVVLDVPHGEHRYIYILEGHERCADPTVLTHERDDFGGENSILLV
jgi:hypothetical protein